MNEEPNWKNVAADFYWCLGGADGGADWRGIEYLCSKYSEYFEENHWDLKEKDET